MADESNPLMRPFHVRTVGGPKPGTFHGGFTTESAAIESAKKANVAAEKLDIETRYEVVPK